MKESNVIVLVDPLCDVARNEEYANKLLRDFPNAKFRVVHFLCLPPTHAQNVSEAHRDQNGDIRAADLTRIRNEAQGLHFSFFCFF